MITARVQMVAILGSLGVLFITLELVRRRKLRKQYSTLWLLTGISLVVLSSAKAVLYEVSRLVGIYYPPSALFLVGFGFVLLILLQYAVVISNLVDRNRKLTQTVGMLMLELNRLQSQHAGPSEPANEG